MQVFLHYNFFYLPDAPVEVSTTRPQNKNSAMILRNKDWLLYVYISAGIVIFTFVVMGISCFIVQRCQGQNLVFFPFLTLMTVDDQLIILMVRESDNGCSKVVMPYFSKSRCFSK